MTESNLARFDAHTDIARADDLHGGYQPMRPLDVYARGLANEDTRIDALATISCGRIVNGLPKAAQKADGQWIYIHDLNDRAPGLTEALQEGMGRRLVIAFPFDNPEAFVQQSFREYSKGSLKAYGDHRTITEIVPRGENQAEHRTFMAGSDEYERVVARCKVNVSVFFALAEWSKEGPRVVFPDGLGMYRLRFTSRNSLRNLLATLDQTAKMTGGRIAGIPFNLGVDFREVADPTGRKRTIPVFTFVMAPPGGISSLTFRSLTGSALAQGEALRMLPSPKTETWETATLDGPIGDDPTDEDVAIIQQGGRCDKRHWTRAWHAAVKGTSLAETVARREFLKSVTNGQYSSLSMFLDDATERQASELISEARDMLFEEGEIIVDDEELEEEPAKLTNDDYVRMHAPFEEELRSDATAQPLTVIETESREIDLDSDNAATPDQEVPSKPTKLERMKAKYQELVAEGAALGLTLPQLAEDIDEPALKTLGLDWVDKIEAAKVSAAAVAAE